jgi:uncharacterized protein (DUF2147 family)
MKLCDRSEDISFLSRICVAVLEKRGGFSMQLPVLALVIALLSIGPVLAADQKTNGQENAAHGFWMTDKGRSKVKVGPCENAKGLCTEIIWLREPNNSRGVPLTDGRNRNVSLRKRPIMGLKILEGLKQIGRYEWEGQVYNPEDGKKYKANLALVKPNTLRLKGCMQMGWPCRSKFWSRTQFEQAAPVEVVEETVDVVVEAEKPPAAVQQAPAEVQTASRPAPIASTPPAQNTPAPANPGPVQIPQQQAAIQPSPPAPSAAPQPVQAAPSNPRISQPTQPAAPPSRTVAAPPPPPPPLVAPVQPQRQAAVAAPQAAPPARNVTPPAPPPAVAQQPRRRNVYPIAPAQPPAATRQPPAASRQPARPNAYPEVAALPSEPAVRRGGGGSSYLVQVAARQDRNEALAVFNQLRRRYPRLLGSTQPIIKRVNLGELGVWYRVRIGPFEGKAAALSFCNRLKFAGSDCFFRRQ